jgi:hypothetical protein
MNYVLVKTDHRKVNTALFGPLHFISALRSNGVGPVSEITMSISSQITRLTLWLRRRIHQVYRMPLGLPRESQ